MILASFDELIPISYLRQYLFCPRIPWYKAVMRFEPPEQGWVTQGKRWHESQNPRHRRRLCKHIPEPREHIVNAHVQALSLGIHGYIDELIFNEEKCVVVEYKVDKGKPTDAQKVQLYAYMLAAEQTYQRQVVAGVLLKGSANKQYTITLDDKIKNKCLTTLHAVRQTLSSHRMPHSSATESKCAQCEYLRYCNDR
ncbi:CRISPR-associated protein Cas4 [Salinivibrio kushneri]|uniref:CRISPR-associated exonuclease Cas4 n=1 Tax=Salinivibrio kushneri TaxID=1908198 RepID=A0AB36K8W7_9GAMM|nr:CRISPR-associated protein Cas4 [Salinivibrio kushneri]OOE44964.1 CRISPR-associated protein Cas4 [Salinivibrio kushneri]